MSVSPTLSGVIALAVFLIFVGLRLGYKVTTTSETDIIDHYVGEFLSEMAANNHVTTAVRAMVKWVKHFGNASL